MPVVSSFPVIETQNAVTIGTPSLSTFEPSAQTFTAAPIVSNGEVIYDSVSDVPSSSDSGIVIAEGEEAENVPTPAPVPTGDTNIKSDSDSDSNADSDSPDADQPNKTTSVLNWNLILG